MSKPFPTSPKRMRLYVTLSLLFSLLRGVSAKPACFNQARFPRPPLYPADIDDCVFVAQLILQGDKANAPIHWSRQEGVGWKLPHMWDVWGKSCFISLDMLREFKEDEVVFAPAKVAQVAVDIINVCQSSLDLPGLGGRDVVGPEGKTVVILAGKVPEAGPKPPGFRGLRMASRLRMLSRQYNTSYGIS
ncbi:MAG: hypothetical protein Q9211_005955 [Gyalolechia sp. 1 TL-2023]